MTRCREHCRCENFGFHCEFDDAELFYRTEYSQSRLLYLIYRTFLFIYQLGWFLGYYIYEGINNPAALRTSYLYLTLWGFAINTIYFTLSFILAFIGYVRRGDLMLTYSKGFVVFRSAVWLIHSVGQTGAIIITVVFWASLAPGLDAETLDDAFNINQHAINSVLYLIEILVVAFPIRILHFVYPMTFGVIYVIATLIYHATGITSAVYPILNWRDSPGIAAAYSVGCIAGCAVVHLLMFLLHLFRIWFGGKCCKSNSQSRSRRHISSGTDMFAYGNSAYERNTLPW